MGVAMDYEKVLAVDEKFLDFCPMELSSAENGALLDAAGKLVATRVEELKGLSRFVEREYTVTKVRRNEKESVIEIMPLISSTGGKSTLFLSPSAYFAEGVISSPDSLAYLQSDADAWKKANFGKLIRAMDEKLRYARSRQAAEFRVRQIDAINAIRHGKAVLR